MPIKQFNFPGVSLTQEYVVSNIGNQATLSVACIGRPYYLHRADVESEAATVEITYTGSTTSAALLPGLTKEVPLDGGTATVAPVDAASGRVFVRDGEFEHVTITGGTWATGLKSTDTTATLKFTGHVVKTGYGHVADTDFGTR
ncbi:MAG: hypothetical protein J6W57_05415, partial [Oscillospiraceae bacterium]|nr:hypothetical protein [Oscillospiraceae bacterium]